MYMFNIFVTVAILYHDDQTRQIQQSFSCSMYDVGCHGQLEVGSACMSTQASFTPTLLHMIWLTGVQ